jgi:chemotaxis receptor (MCP) glutamine deamidase CheD
MRAARRRRQHVLESDSRRQHQHRRSNVAAARQALHARGVPIVAEDVGSDYGRSVHFFLDDGRVEVRSLKKGDRVL